MTPEEIEVYRQRLRDILNGEDDDQRIGELEQLAKEVGAGYVHQEVAGITKTKTDTGETSLIHYNPISESELVLNINNALQTETMINMCKIAKRNFVIALIATIIALGSSIASWVAICK